MIRKLEQNARFKAIFQAIGLHTASVRMEIYSELLAKVKSMTQDRALVILTTLYKGEFRRKDISETDLSVMMTHVRDHWIPNTMDVIESDKHILDISESLHT